MPHLTPLVDVGDISDDEVCPDDTEVIAVVAKPAQVLATID
jgi:hypothetical protein